MHSLTFRVRVMLP